MAEQTNSFLVELGTEELPPKALLTLATALGDGIVSGLKDAKLTIGEHQVFAAPRRLAVLVKGVPARQQDQKIQRRGPAVAAAYKDGEPTQAALGFAKSCGVELADLEEISTDKGAWLSVNIEQKGAMIETLLPDIVAASLAALPVPKRMRWGSSDVEFVRPVHWLLMLYGSDVVAADILGLNSSNVTRGHRFHNNTELTVSKPEDYLSTLKNEGKVIADFHERRELISQGVADAAKSAGATALVEDALLDEVTALVEWPVPVVGNFEEEFLEIPEEVLITTMKDNQKYFPLFDGGGKLLPKFITISNIESKEPEQVQKGNEVVVRPRLADAMFFWQQDKKKPLESHREALEKVVFQNKLGSVAEKSDRVEKLALAIASQIGADSQHTARAAQLSKCDLLTEMVGEFASLQGVMGERYATLEGEPQAVARALSEQYLPRFADDGIAQTGVGQSLAIADRLDTIVGIFAIGQKPSGVKDPFALRRLSLGVLRTLIEGELELDLEALLTQAADGLSGKAQADVPEVFEFMLERLRAYYLSKDISPQIFDSVASVKPTSPLDFDRRINAVKAFTQLPEAESLAAANKRINNILKKNSVSQKAAVDSSLFEGDAESDLYKALSDLKPQVTSYFEAGDYTPALQALSQLRTPVDTFFDQVMVMAEDDAIKNNRLALLSEMRELNSHVANLGALQS